MGTAGSVPVEWGTAQTYFPLKDIRRFKKLYSNAQGMVKMDRILALVQQHPLILAVVRNFAQGREEVTFESLLDLFMILSPNHIDDKKWEALFRVFAGNNNESVSIDSAVQRLKELYGVQFPTDQLHNTIKGKYPDATRFDMQMLKGVVGDEEIHMSLSMDFR